MAKAKILIVDDDYPHATMLASMLEDNGYDVEVTSDGTRAMTMVRRQRPDLVIADLMMQCASGLLLAEAIRNELGGARPPVILVTSVQGAVGKQRPDLLRPPWASLTGRIS